MTSRELIPIATDAAGAGTATARVSGVVVQVRCNSPALTTGGSADITLTRIEDAGTILALTNQAAGPWEYNPRLPVNTLTGGTTAYSAGLGVYQGGVPVDGEVRLVIAQGALSASGTVHVYYDG